MALSDHDLEVVRQYLLGHLSDSEQQKVEERLLSEDDLFEELEVTEDELIEEYVAGQLTSKERQWLEQNLLTSSEGKRKHRFAVAFKKVVTPTPAPFVGTSASQPLPISWWQKPFFTSPMALVAAVLVIAGLSFVVWRGFLYQSDVDKGLIAFNAAYREQRPVEARITQLNYAPFVTTRGPGTAKFNESELRRAELTLLDALNKNPTPAVHHALGRVYLAKKDFDQAIVQFDEALKGDPKNAQLYSDLGAAWLEKGKIERVGPEPGKGLEDFARSLEKLNQALELNPNLLEALFNRAIVHQEMMLPQQAEEGWKKYLEKDPNSKWADEARQNLRLLEEQKKKTSRTKEELLQDFLSAYAAGDDERAWQVISRSREALSRTLIWEQLLDEYLEASKQGRTNDADRNLQALSYEGDLESLRAGDQYVSSLARFYRSSSENQLAMLAEARILMKLGHEYYFQHKMDNAGDSYTKARQIFSGLRDEGETQYAQHWIGYCYYEQGKTEQSLLIFEELAQSLQKDSHLWLLMRTLHVASSAYHNVNEYSKAINYNRQALSLAERINDTIGIFNASSILAFQYGSTGNHRQALGYVQRSLSVMPYCPLNQIQFARHYATMAWAFDSAAFYHAAIDYQKEALRRAVAIGHVQHISLDYARLGLMYGKLGKFGEAFRNLDLAYITGQSYPEETPRKEMMAFSSLQTGHLYREQGDFSKAISSYDQSIALSYPLHFQDYIYEAHKNRLFCYITLKDDPSAWEELKTTLDLAERYRSTIVEGDNRNSFFDIQQSVYDLAIDFAYSRLNDSQKAFQYSEDSRSRSLLDSVTGHTDISSEKQGPDITFESVAQPLTLKQIQERMADQAQILQYGVLNDKVLIWVISKEKFSAVEKRISQRELEKRVIDYIRAVGAPTDTREDVESSAKGLFETLIKPAESLLDRNKPVYLVPDKFLNSLPFGTLISPASGRFLVEDYLLEVSPSSSLFVILSEIASKKEGTSDERLLSVGNPRFDRNDFPALSDLPSASREAEQVAACYGSMRLLTGANATHRQVNNEMLNSEIIHLALHSLADERSPMHSKLVLAKDSTASSGRQDSDGSLQAYEIYRLKLPRTRLAVLSACQTGVERYYGGEGMISLARPFLAAGVPLVVVSLWPVDSDSTAELMISFHKHRKQDNLPSAEALRRAQLEMLNGPEERFHHAFSWGAFVLIGGFTSF